MHDTTKPQARVHQTCAFCVMDTTDTDISFDEEGVCNHCRRARAILHTGIVAGAEGEARLEGIAARIRKAGEGKPYDCVLGISGGIDSAYVALLAIRKMKLRPLAVHVDNGWNSEVAVRNIERICATLNLDLYTEVLKWDEFRDLQLAFLRSGVPNLETPTDHVYKAVCYRLARKHGIRFFLSGQNYATESILPQSWGYDDMDLLHIRAVHKRFGTRPISSIPTMSYITRTLWDTLYKFETVTPLNYVDYDRDRVINQLTTEFGWEYYGAKHFESVYTRFFQGYILPTKFGFDKRKAHLSSLVAAGQMSREAALEELAQPSMPSQIYAADRQLLLDKFELTAAEFDSIMAEPPKTHRDYPNAEKQRRNLTKVWRLAKRLLGLSPAKRTG